MTTIDNIRAHFLTLHNIVDNVTIIDNCDLFNIATISKGILIIYASWSRPAIVNIDQTIKILIKINYTGKIFVFDIDVMAQDFQIYTFGELCHGWGEIFIVRDGKITNKFPGAKSFQNFKEYLRKQMLI
jgi:hypothetical protein